MCKNFTFQSQSLKLIITLNTVSLDVKWRVGVRFYFLKLLNPNLETTHVVSKCRFRLFKWWCDSKSCLMRWIVYFRTIWHILPGPIHWCKICLKVSPWDTDSLRTNDRNLCQRVVVVCCGQVKPPKTFKNYAIFNVLKGKFVHFSLRDGVLLPLQIFTCYYILFYFR